MGRLRQWGWAKLPIGVRLRSDKAALLVQGKFGHHRAMLHLRVLRASFPTRTTTTRTIRMARHFPGVSARTSRLLIDHRLDRSTSW